MNKIRITAIQRGCVYDGPGVRTTIFLKGCSLHCPWCCNPETISVEPQWYIDDSKCLYFQGVASQLCKKCIRCGGKNEISECPFGVSENVSEELQTNDLLHILMKDETLLKKNGGVTFSGGEPLLQTDNLLPLLSDIHKRGIHVTFETTLYVSPHNVVKVVPYMDLSIVDLKLQREQGDLLHYWQILIENLECLQSHGILVKYRLVFVDSVLNDRDLVLQRLNALGVRQLELIKCHNLGSKKYQKLMLEAKSYVADEAKYKAFADFLKNNGINVSLLMI